MTKRMPRGYGGEAKELKPNYRDSIERVIACIIVMGLIIFLPVLLRLMGEYFVWAFTSSKLDIL